MAQFDQAIQKAEAEMKEAQSKIDLLTGQIEAAQSKLEAGEDISIDIENATLDDVHSHTEAMNANIADLIMGLDDVTAGFSEDFDAMREKTGWETFVGIFSGAKSDSMRQERMRTASIDDKLQDLITKSDTIVSLLKSQLETLNVHKGLRISQSREINRASSQRGRPPRFRWTFRQGGRNCGGVRASSYHGPLQIR